MMPNMNVDPLTSRIETYGKSPADSLSNDQRLRAILEERYKALPELHARDGIGITEEQFIRNQIDGMAVGNVELPAFLQQAEKPRFNPNNPLAPVVDGETFGVNEDDDTAEEKEFERRERASVNAAFGDFAAAADDNDVADLDGDAKYIAEYSAQHKAYQSMGLTLPEYIRSRKIEDGLEPLVA